LRETGCCEEMTSVRRVAWMLLILLPACQGPQQAAPSPTTPKENGKAEMRHAPARSEVLDSSDGGDEYTSLVSVQLLSASPPDLAQPANGLPERDQATECLVFRDRSGAKALTIDDHALRSTYHALAESVEVIDTRQVLITYSCSQSATNPFTGWNVLVDGLNARVVYVRPLM
jgi:hypothetical protein